MKILLILVDAMRPDTLNDIPSAQDIMSKSTVTLNATCVYPSHTLPCHLSLFLSVDPKRHGVYDNTFIPMREPIDGLCEVLSKNKKSCAFFYTWDEIRDLARYGSLNFSYIFKGEMLGYAYANTKVSDEAIKYLNEYPTDFAFLYMGHPDVEGHFHGWMSTQYMDAIEYCWKDINRVIDALPDDYTIIITADHGGHNYDHGTTLPEDMLIPIIIHNKSNAGFNADLSNANIMDFAPSICDALGVEPNSQWEGKSFFVK